MRIKPACLMCRSFNWDLKLRGQSTRLWAPLWVIGNIIYIYIYIINKYIYIYIYIYIYKYGILYIIFVFFGFCLILALGVFNIGQKGCGMLTKILPARQTHFWEFFWAPFGENTFSKNASPPNRLEFTKITEALAWAEGCPSIPTWLYMESHGCICDWVYTGIANISMFAPRTPLPSPHCKEDLWGPRSPWGPTGPWGPLGPRSLWGPRGLWGP